MRTARATESARRRKTERLALELAARLGQLSDDWLVHLACLVLEQVGERDLEQKMKTVWEEKYG